MARSSATDAAKSLLHKKATYTFPPDVLEAIDEHWRFHKTIAATLADSKSEYVADLVRRDASKKSEKSAKK